MKAIQLGYTSNGGLSLPEIVCQNFTRFASVTIPPPERYLVEDAAYVECLASETRFDDGLRAKHVNCMGNGNWDSDVTECLPGTCEPPSQPQNAVMTSASVFTYGRIVDFACAEAHEFPDDTAAASIECTAAEWNSTLPDCKIIHCPGEFSIDNANTDDADATSYGSTRTYTCGVGYTFPDAANSTEMEAVCTANKTWERRWDACEPVECPKIPRMPNVFLNSSLHHYTDSVEMLCRPTYQLQLHSERVVTCMANGTWDADIEDCAPYFCLPIPTWEGSILSTNETRANSSVYYKCQPDLHFEGSREFPNVTLHARCNFIGMWSPALKKCIEFAPPDRSIPITESESAKTIGTMVIIISAICAVVVVISDIPTCYTVMRTCKHNLSFTKGNLSKWRNNMASSSVPPHVSGDYLIAEDVMESSDPPLIDDDLQACVDEFNEI